MSAPVHFIPRPLQDLTAPEAAQGLWMPAGCQPMIELRPDGAPHPSGWVAFCLGLEASVAFQPVQLAVQTGNEQDVPVVFSLPGPSAGRIEAILRLPDRVEGLCLLFSDGAPAFRLGAVHMRPMGKAEAGLRLGWPAFRRRLGQPRALFRAVGNIGRLLATRGPRVAIRHLADGILAASAETRAMRDLDPAEHDDAARYRRWIAENEDAAAGPTDPAQGPLISLLIMAGDAPPERLARTLDSLEDQAGWQALVAGGGLERSDAVRPVATDRLADLAAEADGEFLAVLEPGDVLAPHALATIRQMLASRPELDLVYSDEDALSFENGRENPYFKPEWSPELLFAFNYFGRVTVIRRALVEAAGGYRSEAGPAAEWDLHLRVAERAPAIGRITQVLCHRSPDSLGDRPAPDAPEAEAYRRVIAACWERQGLAAQIATQADGTQRSSWVIADPPLVSVIIPNRNKAAMLRVCTDGLLTRTAYPKIELIIVDNLSDEPETHALYRELAERACAKIVRYAETFNYSAACNAGARAAGGELLLFLNNDIEIVDPDWLAELVRFVKRPGVGVVGNLLVFPDGSPQHAGVVVGMHICGLLFREAPLDDWGVFGGPLVPRTCLAVMGACQMIRRELFDAIGGFDEGFRLANGDIALCLAARRAGYRTAYTPFARLIHHEGATRGHSNPREDLQRTVLMLSEEGIAEDPYFHPGLSASRGIPTLRIGSDLGMRDYLYRETRSLLADFPPPSALDLFDDTALAEALGADPADLFWPAEDPAGVADRWAAARFLIDLVRRQPALRQRFTERLSGGPDGAFARWLNAEGPERLRLSERGLAAIAEVLADPPSARVRHIFTTRDELRADYPLGPTPAGRRELLCHLFANGRQELRLEEIWWFAFECAERPAAELVAVTLFQPTWQRLFPDGLTMFGRRQFGAWLARFFGLADGWASPAAWPLPFSPAQQIRLGYWAHLSWRTAHPRPFASRAGTCALLDWLASDQAPIEDEAKAWCARLDREAVSDELLAGGVNVLGHFCYPSGLRTSVESLTEGLRRTGVAVSRRDILADASGDDPHHAAFGGLEIYDTTIIHTQPEPFFSAAYARAGVHERQPRTYRIGYWYWETDSIPESWLEQAGQLDELWAATHYVADAMRQRFPQPVFHMMPGVELPAFEERPRAAFGLDGDRFTFLFVFHMMSIMERKNPLALIKAYRQAFGDDERTALVLKTSFGDKHPALMAELERAADGSGITIIDKIYSQDDTLALMQACDCYASLHRSEGFGLTMAEAMLLGKPVIATGYSGNVDFMDHDNSLLVDYRLITLQQDYPPYVAGSRWAEPSIDHAAQLMRRVFDDPASALALGAKARADLEERMSLAAAGRRMADRLKQIAGT
jgi:GT2 family glycosyltransferase/glycosyltransferase involved in cell wall biosynthesis